MTGLSDYQNIDGFSGDAQSGADLLKAMQAGQITGRDTANQGLTQEPLKAESLEKTLKLLTFRMQDIRLMNAMPKSTAYNTVEEFLQLDSYGADRGGFYNEGELSDVEDSTYIRRAELVKYIQVTGEVTMQAQMVRSFVDAYQKEVENKMMWIMRKVNSSLTKADSSIIPQEFNGIYKQHASIGSGQEFTYNSLDDYHNDNPAVIDLRGEPLTQEIVEEAAINVDDAFGNVDSLFAPPSVISDLAKDYYEKQRILLNGSGNNFVGGGVPKSISTSIGDVNLMTDKFMKSGGAGRKASKVLSDNATSQKAPNQVGSTSAALSGADGSSKFTTDEGGLGTVFYAVGSLNRYGESQLKLINSSAVTLTNGQSVDLTFGAGGGAVPATGYQVYRTKVTASTDPAGDNIPFYPLFRVSESQRSTGFDGGSAGEVRDRNRYLPDTEQAFTTEMTDEVLSFKQLAPISKLDLAVLSMSRRFISFLFGTPQVFSNKKLVRIINVGKRPNE